MEVAHVVVEEGASDTEEETGMEIAEEMAGEMARIAAVGSTVVVVAVEASHACAVRWQLEP